MRVELAPALILHRRAWRDTSVLVEAFAREHGRIGLLAKGARRPKSRWQGVLEPLTGLALSWTGRGELHTLTDVDTPRRYRLSGHALMGGFYASELIMRLLARDDPHPPLYDSLIALLDGLDAGAPAIVALRFFERDLLDVLGYGISLEATSDDDTAVVAGGRYLYHPDTGLRQARGAPGPGEVQIAGDALRGLAAGRFDNRADVRAARDLMQAAIAPHLGGRPLKSVATLQAMQQFAAGTDTQRTARGDPT